MSSEYERLIQVGTVTAVDYDAHKVRVKFHDTGITSDWLCVLSNVPAVSIGVGGVHSHDSAVSVEAADGHSHEASLDINQADGHMHTASVSRWMPGVNDTVLVVYLPIFNSDGFVIGGI